MPACQSVDTRSRPGVSEQGGVFTAFVPTDYGTAWDAVSDTAKQMNLTVVHRRRPEGQQQGVLEGRDAGANLVRIGVQPGTLESTQISVQVEPGHNESLSLLILGAVRDTLKKNN